MRARIRRDLRDTTSFGRDDAAHAATRDVSRTIRTRRGSHAAHVTCGSSPRRGASDSDPDHSATSPRPPAGADAAAAHESRADEAVYLPRKQDEGEADARRNGMYGHRLAASFPLHSSSVVRRHSARCLPLTPTDRWYWPTASSGAAGRMLSCLMLRSFVVASHSSVHFPTKSAAICATERSARALPSLDTILTPPDV